MRKSTFLTLIAAFTLVVAVPAVVQAHEGDTEHKHPTTTTTERRETAQTNAAEKKEQRVAKLEAKKLEICEKREAAINKKMQNIVKRAENQLAVFTKISERTQTFYTEKNRTVVNYSTLVADATAKKTAAEEVVNTLKNSTVEFKCDGTDPKGAGASFRENQKAVITALKDYKTAVKNLIVGVKSANGAANSSENKPTENTPTTTPTGGTQ